jgi:hypothetical protein
VAGDLMGVLAKALSPVSAYAAKKTTLWPDLCDRIAGALLFVDLLEIELWLDFHELEIPGGWWEPLREMIERRREELQAEDVGEILRDRFDFEP